MKIFDWFKNRDKMNSDNNEIEQSPEVSGNDLIELKEMAKTMKHLEEVSKEAYYKMLNSTIELAYLDSAHKRYSELVEQEK